MLRIKVNFKIFTPANTGLEKATQFPELGSVFKAAFMKAAAWFFAKTALDLARTHPAEPQLWSIVFSLVCLIIYPVSIFLMFLLSINQSDLFPIICSAKNSKPWRGIKHSGQDFGSDCGLLLELTPRALDHGPRWLATSWRGSRGQWLNIFFWNPIIEKDINKCLSGTLHHPEGVAL